MNTEKTRLRALDPASGVVRLSLTDRAYSAIVKKLRWVLPVAAMGIVASLMLWPRLQDEFARNRFEPAKVDRADIEKAATENTLKDAMFSSVDSKGRPFSIIADEARSDAQNPDLILLARPRGSLKLDSGLSMSTRAATGTYAQKNQVLDLAGKVEVQRSDGTIMKSDTLQVDLMSNDAQTQTPVSVTGPDGTLDATGMKTSNGGANVVFTGPAKLVLKTGSTINPKKRQK